MTALSYFDWQLYAMQVLPLVPGIETPRPSESSVQSGQILGHFYSDGHSKGLAHALTSEADGCAIFLTLSRVKNRNLAAGLRRGWNNSNPAPND